MNAKQLAMMEALTFGPSDFHCELNADSDSGYQFGNGYAYGTNNQPYSVVCREADDMIAFIPTDVGEAFATCDWLQRFNDAGKPDRKAQTAAAIAAHRIPQGWESQEITIQAPKETIAAFKRLTPKQRGELIESNIEFPWAELDRLQKFEAAVKTAQNILGD